MGHDPVRPFSDDDLEASDRLARKIWAVVRKGNAQAAYDIALKEGAPVPVMTESLAKAIRAAAGGVKDSHIWNEMTMWLDENGFDANDD